MLRFLRKSLPSIRQRHRFLCKTVCLSAGIHALLALGVVVGICFSPSHTVIVRKEQSSKQARIVLVPFARRVAADTIKTAQQRVAAVPKVAQAPKKPLAPQKVVPPQRTTTVNKQTTQITQSNEKKKSDQKKLDAAPVIEKDKKKTKPLAAKKEQNKPEKVVENKPTPSKALPKPVEHTQKPKAEEVVVAQGSSEPSCNEDEQVLYVGREEMQELRLYKAVCRAVEKEWRPPAGLPATSVCHIAFVVGSEGVAQDVQVVESSKMLAYDIAARSAVSRARFEPYTRGKKCTVVFKL